MVYHCIRCLAATDNDYDICDNCLEETKNNKALMRAAEGFVRLNAEIKRLRAELASERNHVAGLRAGIARLREALTRIYDDAECNCRLIASEALERKDVE